MMQDSGRLPQEGEHERIRDALRKSAKYIEDLKFAIDQAAIVTVTDPDGHIRYANDKMLEVSKYRRDEVIGKSHREFNSGLHPKEFFKTLWETVTAGRIWRGEVCNKAKDGSLFWVDTTIVPFMGDDGMPYQFMCIRKDITQRKKAEAELKEERARRLYLDRLTAIGEMAAGIAHEIRNPLMAILLQSQLLQRREGDGESGSPVRETGKRIEETAKRIEKIITSLQSLSRNAELDPSEEACAGDLFEDALGICQENFQRRGIRLIVEPEGLGLTCWCRPSQISQVLLNLLNNARDAVEQLEDRWIRLRAELDGSFVLLSVTDSGGGIAPEARSRVMEAFFTTKKPGKGTGLGLNISRKIMENHGGALVLDEACPNTRFVCKLPRPSPRD